jgi:hypothetical protein
MIVMAFKTEENQRYSWMKNSRSLLVKLYPALQLVNFVDSEPRCV